MQTLSKIVKLDKVLIEIGPYRLKMGLFGSIFSFLDITTVLLGMVVFMILSWMFRGRHKNLPPGPRGYPIIGNIPYFASCKKEFPEALLELSKKYGNVIFVSFGASKAVVLNDISSIQMAMNHPDLQDRPERAAGMEEKLAEIVGGKSEGIAMASGKAWKDQRKFLVNAFRGFGVGKSSFEDAVAMEADAMMTVMLERKDMSFDPQIMLSNALSNIICSVTFGKRFEYNDPKFDRLLSLVLRQFEVIGSASILAAFPILTKFEFGPIKEVLSNVKEFAQFFQGIINDHKSAFNDKDINDIVDAYLSEIISSDKTGSPDPEVFNDMNLGAVIADLFFAGIDSSVSSLRWALVYFIINPHLQTQFQEELDRVVGRDRMPRWEDRSKMPFVEATIAEVQRIGTVAAIGGTHAASKDVNICGYTIPSGVAVIPNVYAVMRDPELWPEPLEFRPQRFLDEEGNFSKPDYFIPFNTGSRQCPGEQLAKMELFIFLTHLLHRFSFFKPKDSPTPSTDGKMGITFKPSPFEMCFTERDYYGLLM